MKVISASRRTDLPAFYSRWLLNRLAAGFCHWQNPFGGQVRRVSLKPDDCLALVFWTRNPAPLMPHLDFVRAAGYRFYFLVTIIGYPRLLETHGPSAAAAIRNFRRLAERYSPDVIHWRYDPIIFSEQTPPEYHLRQFTALCDDLAGFTRRCYFSFVDFYGKTRRNLAVLERQSGLRCREAAADERLAFSRRLAEIAGERGIALCACCEPELAVAGIAPAHCIDRELVGRLRPDSSVRLAAAPSRPGCGCAASVDIGAYDTCGFGCAYCYATTSRAAAVKHRREHDPLDSILWRPANLRGVRLPDEEEQLNLPLKPGGR